LSPRVRIERVYGPDARRPAVRRRALAYRALGLTCAAGAVLAVMAGRWWWLLTVPLAAGVWLTHIAYEAAVDQAWKERLDMALWRPGLGEFFDLDETTVRTEYLRAKGARLVLAHQFTHLEWKSTLTEQWFAVRGDHAAYRVVLRPLTDPWSAACSRGGVHEMTPDGQACAHGVVAAVAWVRLNPRLRKMVEEVQA
jgi:hypothetical protein